MGYLLGGFARSDLKNGKGPEDVLAIKISSRREKEWGLWTPSPVLVSLSQNSCKGSAEIALGKFEIILSGFF
jgi:hypothetical protein